MNVFYHIIRLVLSVLSFCSFCIWNFEGRAAFAQAPAVPRSISNPLPDDPMHVTVDRLPNGLTVYLSPNPQEPRVTAWIAVRAGAKNDPPASTGMAHYLEHMMFKGSQKLGTLDYQKEKTHLDKISQLYERLFHAQEPRERQAIYSQIDAENVQATQYAAPNELDRLYEEMGFEGVNAHTSYEETVFVDNFPANRAELWARAESDRFSRPVFRLFQTEIEAVFEEKNRSMDNAGNILNEALERRLFKFHPYGQYTVLGSTEHLKNPSLTNMYAYFGAYYRPNNMAVALSGDFDREAMLKLIEKYFGALPPAELPPTKVWPLPKPKGVERVEVKYEAEEQAVIAWMTVPHHDPDADALTVMDMIFDNAQAGIANLTLNQAQKVKASGSYPNINNDAGAWYVWAAPKKGQTLEEAETLLLETVDKLRAGNFTDEDIQAVITDFEVEEKKRLESNDARVGMMTESFTDYDEWEYTLRRLDRLRRVTKADVVRVANRYLGPDRVVAYRRQGKPVIPSIEKPKFTQIAIDPTRRSEFFKELERLSIKPLEPRWLKEGRDYRIFSFPWGKLYAAKNPINDLFAINFKFDRGRKHVREMCEALDLLDLAGAGELTAEAFKKKLYGLGAAMSVYCGEQESGVGLTGLDKNFEKSLELMFRRFEAPNIAADTLKKMVEVQIGAHRDNKKDPGFIQHALREYAMRGGESAVLTDLTDAELQSLKEEDLRRQIRSLFDYSRNALYVGIRDPQAVGPLLTAGRKEFKPTPTWEPHRYLKPAKPRVLFAHRDMVQSRVGIYAADEAYDPKQSVDYKFYNTYMGGMSGVIFQEVRESRALAYSAGGGYNPGERKDDENVLSGAAGCQADKSVETAALLGSLLQKIPVSPERFQLARKAVEEDYRTDVIRFRDIPETILHWEELGIEGGDPRPERFQRALKYGQDDLIRFARRFETKPLTTYVLGNRNRVGVEGLRKMGDFEEKTVDQLFPY